MKQSGIDWIGEIPDDWKIIRLKHIFQIKKDIAGKEGFTVLSVTQTGIRPKDMSSKGQFALDYSKYQLVNSGEFIMNHMDLKTGWIDISKYNGVTSPDYRVFYLTNNNCIKDYYKQIFQYCYKNLIFFSLGQGVADLGRWRLPADMFNNFKLPLPPKATQERIAEYLDKKVSEIDSIIEESKKSIEEYKAWKQSVIFEAVTGKNLNCKKKDSGIEWIGEIPENYKLIRLKFLLKEKLQYGANSSGIEFTSDLPRYIRITDIKDSKTLYDENKLSLSEEDAKDYILDDNDILFARSGATSGKCFIYKKEIGKATFAGYLIRAKIDETKLLPNFLVLYTMTKAYEEWKNQVCIQATIQNISAEKYVNLIVPVPPLSDQESIAKMLDSKCAQIDSLIAEKESLIADLTEYKKSLIFEVVTGKRSI